MESLGVPIQYWDTFLVYFVTRRLDSKTLEAWELEQNHSTELATFVQLEHFIEGRIRALESVQSRATTAKAFAAQKPNGKSKPARTTPP